MKKINFKDKASYDSKTKTVLSVRDGVLEYLAYELGIDDLDPNRVIRVKRTPATISNAAMKMANIPVTDEHVEVGVDVADAGGNVLTSEMVDVVGEGGATIAIKNSLNLTDEFINLAKTKRELSLGYTAKLVACEDGECDFEQVDITPHHLAIVDNGRCGDMCSFVDKKPTIEKVDDMKFKFKDATMEEIVEVLQGLPEAIQKVPTDMIEEILPALKEVIAASKELMTEESEEDMAEEVSEEAEDVVEEAEDVVEEAEELEEEVEDSEEDKDFGDSKAFADAVAVAVAKEVKARVEAIDKAKHFVDCDMTEMTSAEIMRAAVEAEHSDIEFADSEIPVAFKLLKVKEVAEDESFEDSRFGFIKEEASTDKFEEWQNS